jgi:hypothetical protein
MTRTSRLIVVLGAVALSGLALPTTAGAQRRPPAGTVSRGSAHVAVPRTSAPYGHSSYRPSYGSYYRPYYGSYYRPYYGSYYSRGYYPYYSPWSFSIGFGFGYGYGYGYGGYAPYYAYPAYPYPSSYAYPYAYPTSNPYPSSGYEAPAADRGQNALSVSRSSDFGTLSLRVSPSDAAIVIDREEWDRPQGGDRFSIELAAGQHQVEVHKQGYGSYVRTIDVPLGRTMILNIGLTPGASGQVNAPGSRQVARTVPLRDYR